MSNLVSRRDFLKLGGAAAGVLAAGAFIPPAVAQAAREAGHLNAQGDGYIPSLCEMCVWRCGLLAKVKDGRVVKLEGNPDHPHSKGKLCPRGQAGIMTTYDPDRVLTPLVRVGSRGEGKFRKASWEEALDIIAKNMQKIKEKYGPEAMVFSSTHNLSQPLFENLLYAFGSPNYGTQRVLCFNASDGVPTDLWRGRTRAGLHASSSTFFFTGRNLAEAISNSETGELIHAIDRGAKLVYLDPRFTKTAAKATEWLPIRPGTDLAFHLAMLNVIIGEGLYNCDFVKQYTVGFDGVASTHTAEYTPEWAEQITEIPAETIRRIAREFAAAKPNALAHNGWRTSNFVNSFQTERAITILNAWLATGRTTMFPAGEDPEAGGRGARHPRSRPTRGTQPCAWMGSRGSIRLFRCKYGVFQQLRDASRGRRPLRGTRLAHLPPESRAMSIPDRTEDAGGLRQDGLHCDA